MDKLCELLDIRPGVTALIGGGGKTTLMYHLARELRERGTVAVTTTTKIWPPTGIAVAHARGVILYTAERLHLPVYEYTPMQIKQAVVGYGLADKHQVMDMTRRLLKLRSIPRPDDAADALAIAMCHARSATSLLRRKDPDVKETV